MSTNMRWLAALLGSNAIAVHPNFRSTDPSSLEAALAGHFLGRFPGTADYLNSDEFEAASADDPAGARLLTASISATTLGSVAQGIAELEGLVSDEIDPAIATSAALIASTALIETDDVESSIDVLQRALDLTTEAHEHRLLRAVLLQGIAHRTWDAGDVGTGEAEEAARNLDQFVPSSAPAFEVSSRVAGGSQAILADIADLVRDASHSYRVAASPDMNARVERLTVERPAIYKEVELRAGGSLEGLQDRSLLDALGGSRNSTTWRNERGDEGIVHALYVFEFAGHPQARYYRHVLGVTRGLMALSNGERWLFRESLRLLRHAGAKKHIDALLRRLDYYGPLEVLKEETYQVAQQCTRIGQLDECTLRVIAIGSACLDRVSASVLLDRLIAARHEAPAQRGFGWQSRGTRIEALWPAIFSVASSAERLDEAAIAFIEDLQSAHTADLDHSYARSFPQGSKLSSETLAAFEAWAATDQANELPGAAQVARDLSGHPAVPPLPDNPALDEVRRSLNAALAAERSPSPADLAAMEPVLRGQLDQIRSSASRGMFTFPGVSATALAVVAAEFGANLWAEIAALILDPAVAREDKVGALDRLSQAREGIPADFVDRLRGQARDLLEGNSTFPERSLNPFPEGLQVLGALRLTSDEDLLVLLSQLLGSGEDGARYEGAQVARQWAVSGRTDPWLEVLLVSLSHSADDEVKGVAMNALCHFQSAGGGLTEAAELRALQLLHSDGSLVPRQVLNGLKDGPRRLSQAIERRIENVAAQHVHREVRALARTVLAKDRS